MAILTWQQFMSRPENKNLPMEEAKRKYQKEAYEFDLKVQGIANLVNPPLRINNESGEKS